MSIVAPAEQHNAAAPIPWLANAVRQPLHLDSLDPLATGFGVIDPDGQLVDSNAALRRLAGFGPDDEGIGRWLGETLARFRGRGALGSGAPIRLPSATGAELIASLFALGSGGGPLLLVLRAARLEIPGGRLVELYRFSPREVELATLLIAGRDLKTAAHQLGITVPTTRVYLRNIFRKTRTGRQSELIIALLAAAAI